MKMKINFLLENAKNGKNLVKKNYHNLQESLTIICSD